MSKYIEVDSDTGELRAKRKLHQSGNSVVVAIPPEMLANIELSVDDPVTLTGECGGDHIVVRRRDDSDDGADTDGGADVDDDTDSTESDDYPETLEEPIHSK